MAIGDAVSALLGTGTVTRQPSSGVEEQISCIAKSTVSDPLNIYDGSNTIAALEAGINTAVPASHSATANMTYYNISIMITNSVYIQKGGTTDRIYVGGVQTNA